MDEEAVPDSALRRPKRSKQGLQVDSHVYNGRQSSRGWMNQGAKTNKNIDMLSMGIEDLISDGSTIHRPQSTLSYTYLCPRVENQI